MIFILRCLRSWEVVKNWKEMLPPKWQEILLHIFYHRLFKTKVFDYHWAVRSIWIDWLKQQTRSERIARLAQLLATEWQSPYGLEKIIQTMITLKIIKRYCWCSEFHPTPVAMQNFPVHLHMFCVILCFLLLLSDRIRLASARFLPPTWQNAEFGGFKGQMTYKDMVFLDSCFVETTTAICPFPGVAVCKQPKTRCKPQRSADGKTTRWAF